MNNKMLAKLILISFVLMVLCTDTVRAIDSTNDNAEGTTSAEVFTDTLSTGVLLHCTLEVSPDPIRRSRRVLIPYLMELHSDIANFIESGTDRIRVTYSPSNAVISMPEVILDPHTICQLVYVKPPRLAGGVKDGTLTVRVNTGSEVLTGFTKIRMLPHFLDE